MTSVDLETTICFWRAVDAPTWACEPFGILDEHCAILYIPQCFGFTDEFYDGMEANLATQGIALIYWIRDDGSGLVVLEGMLSFFPFLYAQKT